MWLNEKNELDKLPEQDIAKLKKLIRKGAQDITQRWANALELVHTAYEVAKIQRPDITMEAAWKQYEEMIAHAVKELAKARGLNDNWRMTSAQLHEREMFKKKGETKKWAVETTIDGFPVVVTREADRIEDVIKPFYEHNITGYDIEMRHRSINHVTLYFVKDGKRTGDKVTIKLKK